MQPELLLLPRVPSPLRPGDGVGATTIQVEDDAALIDSMPVLGLLLRRLVPTSDDDRQLLLLPHSTDERAATFRLNSLLDVEVSSHASCGLYLVLIMQGT